MSTDTAELEDNTMDDKVDMEADNSSNRMMLNMIVENRFPVKAFISMLGTTPSNPPGTFGSPFASA